MIAGMSDPAPIEPAPTDTASTESVRPQPSGAVGSKAVLVVTFAVLCIGYWWGVQRAAVLLSRPASVETVAVQSRQTQSIELVAIGDDAASNWWSPDGQPLTEDAAIAAFGEDNIESMRNSTRDDEPPVEGFVRRAFLFRVRQPAGGATPRMRPTQNVSEGYQARTWFQRKLPPSESAVSTNQEEFALLLVTLVREQPQATISIEVLSNVANRSHDHDVARRTGLVSPNSMSTRMILDRNAWSDERAAADPSATEPVQLLVLKSNPAIELTAHWTGTADAGEPTLREAAVEEAGGSDGEKALLLEFADLPISDPGTITVDEHRYWTAEFSGLATQADAE